MPFPQRHLLRTTGCLLLLWLLACTTPKLRYATNPATETKGVAIAANAPLINLGSASSFSVSPALPAGISLDTTSGVITGTPTTAKAAATYVVTAVVNSGNITCNLTITLKDDTVLAIQTEPANRTVQVGQTALFSVAAVGPAILSYQGTRNGAPIHAATVTNCVTPATVLGDDGALFGVIVNDSQGGSLTSVEASLPVTPQAPGVPSATGGMADRRAFHTATLLATGTVLVAGGLGPGPTLLSATELYNPGSSSSTASGDLKTARERHTATLLSEGKVLITGGFGGGGYLSSAELYQ